MKLFHPRCSFWSLTASLMPKICGWSDGVIFFPSLHFSRIIKSAFCNDGAVLVDSIVGVRFTSSDFLKFSFDGLFWQRSTWVVFSFSVLHRGQRE